MFGVQIPEGQKYTVLHAGMQSLKLCKKSGIKVGILTFWSRESKCKKNHVRESRVIWNLLRLCVPGCMCPKLYCLNTMSQRWTLL